MTGHPTLDALLFTILFLVALLGLRLGFGAIRRWRNRRNLRIGNIRGQIVMMTVEQCEQLTPEERARMQPVTKSMATVVEGTADQRREAKQALRHAAWDDRKERNRKAREKLRKGATLERRNEVHREKLRKDGAK